MTLYEIDQCIKELCNMKQRFLHGGQDDYLEVCDALRIFNIRRAGVLANLIKGIQNEVKQERVNQLVKNVDPNLKEKLEYLK